MPESLSLLLVDDDEVDRRSLVRSLRGSPNDIAISEARTATEGLELASQVNFDAILLDYLLPDMTGLELLNILQRNSEHGLAVIMLSRYDDWNVTQKCLEAGAQDFLSKDEVTAKGLYRAILHARQRFALTEQLRIINAQLLEMSERDALTGLCNRRGFDRTLKNTIQRASYEKERVAVLLIDLDEFKLVNDTLGHDVGDQLLIQIAQNLSSVVRDSDLLCRLGGDEFVIIAKHLEHEEQAALLAERIVSLLKRPITVNNVELHVTASVGIAIWGSDEVSPQDLLKNADVAMYRAKQEGRNQYRFYSENIHIALEYRTRLKRDLVGILDRNELQLAYQAQISCETGKLQGVEALIRWKHPNLGRLSPNDFLPIAEESGLMMEIGAWVLAEACRTFSAWSRLYPEKIADSCMSVNLSASQIKDPLLVNIVRKALSENGLSNHQLELELTESAFISETIDAIIGLSRLGLEGIQLALDDFGTGYSSLQHLKMFPINTLKIDRSFISSIGQSKIDEKLLVALIKFAKLLDLKVVAEGIENEAQAQFCKDHGCDLLQGYFYSFPTDAENFEAQFLKN